MRRGVCANRDRRRHAGAKEEILRGFVIAEGADGVAAEFGVFGDEGGLVGFGVELALCHAAPKARAIARQGRATKDRFLTHFALLLQSAGVEFLPSEWVSLGFVPFRHDAVDATAAE
jgi:hypothetical protein